MTSSKKRTHSGEEAACAAYAISAGRLTPRGVRRQPGTQLAHRQPPAEGMI